MPAPKGNQGIYKITSPSGRIYIGQTVDFKTRFSKYRLLHCKGQKRLFNSLMKYGFIAHIFEIIEACELSALNKRERHYQDLYNVIGSKGLNCKLTSTTEKKGRHSKETKKKISESHLGKKLSKSHIAALKAAKQNISLETREKISLANIGKKISEETKNKFRERMKGNKYTLGITPVNAKKVLNTDTGMVYQSRREAAESLGIKPTTLGAKLTGKNNNNTPMRYL